MAAYLAVYLRAMTMTIIDDKLPGGNSDIYLVLDSHFSCNTHIRTARKSQIKRMKLKTGKQDHPVFSPVECNSLLLNGLVQFLRKTAHPFRT